MRDKFNIAVNVFNNSILSFIQEIFVFCLFLFRKCFKKIISPLNYV